MLVLPSIPWAPPEPDSIIYPTSDGKPMADNTLQWDWIVLIKNGLETLFAQRDDVFIASDLLWYPVEGNPRISTAPDVMAVFGRPKGVRGSYMQWKEGGLPFQVVFEILSPSNSGSEMARKIEFYRRYGVLEYYLYDPGDLRKELRKTRLTGWRRDDVVEEFVEIEEMDGWCSPLLGITFRHDPKSELQLFFPDGRPFETLAELTERAEENARRAEENARRAEENARLAQQNADRVAQLLAQLRAAGIKPEITD